MKKWLTLVLIFAALGGLVTWMLVSEDQRNARMTVKGSAVLTAVKFDPDDESRSLDETDFEYSFDAGGRKIAGSDSLPGDRMGDFSVGQQVTICYNPSDPSESNVETDPAVKCGS